HVNTEILKENQNLRNELKELTSIIEAWLNKSNKDNQCINEQIPTQKRKILGIDQLTEDTSSFGPEDLVFVKSSVDNLEVSITDSNKPKLSEAEDSTLSNHDTSKHPFPPPEKLTRAEPVSGPKTIKSILKSKSTFKAETLKGITINEPSSAPARGNKSSLVSKTNLAPAGKFDGKANEGFFVGYSVNSKAFKVFNGRTRIVEENLHITFLDISHCLSHEVNPLTNEVTKT
ncbi:hypothetical protein Tco_1358242, partial [Tanacetum coccineum]